MSNVAFRKRLGSAAHAEMKEYKGENIWNKWDELIKQILNNLKQILCLVNFISREK